MKPAGFMVGCVVLSVLSAPGAHAKPPVGVKHECPTAIDVDGNVLATTETHKCWERVNRLVNPAKGRWLWTFDPPAEYDIPYTGILMIQRLPIDQIHNICSKRSGTGCAMVVSTCPSCNGGKGGWQISQTGNRAACVIIIPTDDYIREHHQDPKSVIR